MVPSSTYLLLINRRARGKPPGHHPRTNGLGHLSPQGVETSRTTGMPCIEQRLVSERERCGCAADVTVSGERHAGGDTSDRASLSSLISPCQQLVIFHGATPTAYRLVRFATRIVEDDIEGPLFSWLAPVSCRVHILQPTKHRQWLMPNLWIYNS